MNYDEFEELSRKAWDECFNYLDIDRSGRKDEGRYCISNEGKNLYNRCTTEIISF